MYGNGPECRVPQRCVKLYAAQFSVTVQHIPRNVRYSTGTTAHMHCIRTVRTFFLAPFFFDGGETDYEYRWRMIIDIIDFSIN